MAEMGKPQGGFVCHKTQCKLPIYVPLVQDSQAWVVNALSISWEGLAVYAFLPTAINTKVLQKLQQHKCSMVLLIPLWVKQRWFPMLLELLVDFPIELPLWAQLLRQLRSSLFHQNAEVYRLHAWKLSGNFTEIRDFQKVLQNEWQSRKRSLLSESTRGSGRSTVIGVKGSDLDPFQVSVGNVAEFMLHCYKEAHLACSTIEGYRTAISYTIKAVSGQDLGKNADLSNLLVNFARDSTYKGLSVPAWDLALVLRMLNKEPFEPIHGADLKHVTLKRVFLVVLASGKRCSELHAMRSEVFYAEHAGSVTIIPDPGFVFKTHLNAKGSQAINMVTLKALTKDIPYDMQEDPSLCVVRVIKYYLKQTSELRKVRQKLFIAYRKGYNAEA